MAYVILVEQLEREVLAERQALLSQGVTEDLPTLHKAQSRLDEALVAEPVRLESVDSELFRQRRALGVA